MLWLMISAFSKWIPLVRTLDKVEQAINQNRVIFSVSLETHYTKPFISACTKKQAQGINILPYNTTSHCIIMKIWNKRLYACWLIDFYHTLRIVHAQRTTHSFTLYYLIAHLGWKALKYSSWVRMHWDWDWKKHNHLSLFASSLPCLISTNMKAIFQSVYR